MHSSFGHFHMAYHCIALGSTDARGPGHRKQLQLAEMTYCTLRPALISDCELCPCFCAPCRSDVERLDRQLRLFSDTLEEWLECQRQVGGHSRRPAATAAATLQGLDAPADKKIAALGWPTMYCTPQPRASSGASPMGLRNRHLSLLSLAADPSVAVPGAHPDRRRHPAAAALGGPRLYGRGPAAQGDQQEGAGQAQRAAGRGRGAGCKGGTDGWRAHDLRQQQRR